MFPFKHSSQSKSYACNPIISAFWDVILTIDVADPNSTEVKEFLREEEREDIEEKTVFVREK